MSTRNRPIRYKDYDSEAMSKAMDAMLDGMSVRKAAETYGVLKSTLGDRVSGKVDLDAKPGPTPYLKTFEKEELASFLICCSKIGYLRTRSQVLGLVQQIVNSKGLDASVSDGWWERF